MLSIVEGVYVYARACVKLGERDQSCDFAVCWLIAHGFWAAVLPTRC